MQERKHSQKKKKYKNNGQPGYRRIRSFISHVPQATYGTGQINTFLNSLNAK